MNPSNALKSVSTLAELKATVAESKDIVFRGQTKNYTDMSGQITMTTSFARETCVPPTMLKWSQYVDSVIRALQGPEITAPTMARQQAILQHYGWRSFYIDATKSPAVAAWFASHKFSRHTTAEMCEDAFEDGVCLISTAARYSLSEEEYGHIYLISKSAIVRSGADCDDLGAEITTEPGLRLRFLEQEACMLGPFQDGAPDSCIVSHIQAPVSVLAQYAKEGGLDETGALFPTPAEDPVLNLLLKTPWVRSTADVGVPTFMQGLNLPMYSSSYIKHLPASVALYSPQFVSDHQSTKSMPELATALFLRTPEHVAYGQPTGATTFPFLTELLIGHGTVIIEFDGLFRYAERSDESIYYKGVVLGLEKDRVSVCALTVQHPGMRISGVGTDPGWHYTISSNGVWGRAPGSDDCTCNAPHRHEQLFCPIEQVEDALKTKSGQVNSLCPSQLT